MIGREQGKQNSFNSATDVSQPLDSNLNLDGSQKEPHGGLRALMFFQLFLILGIIGIWAFCHL
jgi:hypothetical protein